MSFLLKFGVKSEASSWNRYTFFYIIHTNTKLTACYFFNGINLTEKNWIIFSELFYLLFSEPYD